MADDGSRTRLGQQSWISLSLLTGILGAAVWGTATAVSGFADIANTQRALVIGQAEQGEALRILTTQMTQMRYDMNEAVSDRWTGMDMRFWAQELQRLNAQVAVPKVERAGHEGGNR